MAPASNRNGITKNKTPNALVASFAASAPPTLSRSPSVTGQVAHNHACSSKCWKPEGAPNFSGGKRRCQCPRDQLQVTANGKLVDKSACYSAKRLKPVTAVSTVVAENHPFKGLDFVHVDKLSIDEKGAEPQFAACRLFHVEQFPADKNDQQFKDLGLVHDALSDLMDWPSPQLAAFAKSKI
ncbi:hypothetical protein CEK25_011201 [Fusarium fujikuroi]|nr:hypothetical protein CEK25_011201 [Fusarium fujikuroi]